MKQGKHYWYEIIAFGLFIGWLAAMFAPISSKDLVDDGSPLQAARVTFYVAVALCVLGGFILERRKRHLPARHTARALMTCLVAACVAVGIANWALSNAGFFTPALYIVSFALSGVAAALLQLWFAPIVGRWPQLSAQNMVAIFVLACFSWSACALTPQIASQPIDVLVPLASWLLILIASRRTAACSTDEPPDTSKAQGVDSTSRKTPTRKFVQSCIGLSLALTACHIFSGTAEFASFVSQPTMIVSVLLGLAGSLCLAYLAMKRVIPAVKLAIICTLIICLSIFIQGLVGMSDAGTAMLEDTFGAIMHVVVFVGDYALFTLGCFCLARAHSAVSHILPVVCTNMGVVIGVLLGMLIQAGASATMVSLAIALVALLLFGMQVGRESETDGDSHARQASERNAAIEQLSDACELSDREREVLDLWASGHQLDYVAERLCISKNTVKTHVAHIYKKTGATCREELLTMLEARSGGRSRL